MHAACIIPLSLYRFTIPTMRRYATPTGSRRSRWITAAENMQLLDEVLKHVRENGLARSADFERADGRRGTWWDWKPAKIALEHLYNTGTLTIANRVNFQRIYGITENVLPDWVDTTPPTEEEAYLTLLDKSARALGICSPMQIPDYFHMKRTPAKPLIQRMLDEGTLLPVNVELHDGTVAEQVVHRANLPLLQRAADGDITPNHTTFLSPFDNLFWAKGRDTQFWGFQQILEAYKPAPQRIWGYFCLPILRNDRLIGRFDPKLERRASTLHLKRLYLEPGIRPEDELVTDIAAAMRSFMAFHDATDLVIEHSKPADCAASSSPHVAHHDSSLPPRWGKVRMGVNSLFHHPHGDLTTGPIYAAVYPCPYAIIYIPQAPSHPCPRLWGSVGIGRRA